jgi:secondary thiamine-phosphate synthase enzyme
MLRLANGRKWCGTAPASHRDCDARARPCGHYRSGLRLGKAPGDRHRLAHHLVPAHLGFAAVQENASPDVRADLETFLARLVPDGGADRYRHAEEGLDDMPAHIRAALTQTQLSIPVAEGLPVLGTWQGIYLWEHRMAPHRRELVLHLLGEQT